MPLAICSVWRLFANLQKVVLPLRVVWVCFTLDLDMSLNRNGCHPKQVYRTQPILALDFPTKSPVVVSCSLEVGSL